MRGIIPRREQGMADPVLAEMVHATGATELGDDVVGGCRLQPHMIDLGSVVTHEFVIACCVAEDYESGLSK